MSSDNEKRRTSRAGRSVHGTYLNMTPLEQITDASHPAEVEDLQIEEAQERVTEIYSFIKSCGCTIFDVCLSQLQSSDESVQQESRSWLKNKAPELIRAVCLSSIRSENTKRTICELASDILVDDIQRLSKSSELRQSATTVAKEKIETFDYDIVWNDMEKIAPLLSSLIKNLVFSKSRKKEITPSVAVENESSDEGDTEENMAPELVDSQHDLGDTLNRRQLRNSKRQSVIMTTVLSSLCYARNIRSNLVQTNMGYYLYAAKTNKRTIENLHRVGISVSYKTVTRILNAVATSCELGVKQFHNQFPNYWVSFDNMNFYAKVRDERQHNQSQLLHYTAGYVAVNPKGRITKMLTYADVDLSKAGNLTVKDLLPDEKDLRRNENAFHAGVYDIINKFFGKQILRNTDNGKVLEPIMPWEVYQIPRQRTIVLSLPTFNQNEALIVDMVAILRGIARETGFEIERFRDNVVMYKGDYLTVRNIRYVN